TDEGKLRQVLINLVGNAVKFTEEGGIALRIGARGAEKETIDLLFEVEDTGPGIAENEIERVFNAFEQTSTGIRSGGTGLGLALSQGFVMIMGGELTLGSTVGKGSIFRFTVPVREGREDLAEKKKARRNVLRLKPGREEIRVLIADDRETNRRLLTHMLSAVGFVTREVGNGEEAIGVFHEWRPRVILMDMTMPVMDGYEATRRIKADAQGKKTVIIAVTASAFEEDRQRVMAAGADGYLAKPFKEAELFEVIRELTGADYLYEEPDAKAVPEGGREQVREAIALLSTDLVHGLYDAVIKADIELVKELLERVSRENPEASRVMAEMAARYEYEELANLLS
ncbi:MAG: response regulator, partial [Spirochaetes bacterium]|nr:response regulator [Spirochaetota bacterium]